MSLQEPQGLGDFVCADETDQSALRLIPQGWSYNPSEWSQRLPIVYLAVCGFGIALYLALYQWGVIAAVWEPFFGHGSRTILDSSCRGFYQFRTRHSVLRDISPMQ